MPTLLDNLEAPPAEARIRTATNNPAERLGTTLATLIAPRGLVVESSAAPLVQGPPPVPGGRRGGAAAGSLGTPAAWAMSAGCEILTPAV